MLELMYPGGAVLVLVPADGLTGAGVTELGGALEVGAGGGAGAEAEGAGAEAEGAGALLDGAGAWLEGTGATVDAGAELGLGTAVVDG